MVFIAKVNLSVEVKRFFLLFFWFCSFFTQRNKLYQPVGSQTILVIKIVWDLLTVRIIGTIRMYPTLVEQIVQAHITADTSTDMLTVDYKKILQAHGNVKLGLLNHCVACLTNVK